MYVHIHVHRIKYTNMYIVVYMYYLLFYAYPYGSHMTNNLLC